MLSNHTRSSFMLSSFFLLVSPSPTPSYLRLSFSTPRRFFFLPVSKASSNFYYSSWGWFFSWLDYMQICREGGASGAISSDRACVSLVWYNT